MNDVEQVSPYVLYGTEVVHMVLTNLLWLGTITQRLGYRFWVHRFSLPPQKHLYAANIFRKLEGPSQIFKKLEDYSEEEVARFPDIVKVPHL